MNTRRRFVFIPAVALMVTLAAAASSDFSLAAEPASGESWVNPPKVAFGQRKPSKSPCITNSETSPSQISPTNSGEEAILFGTGFAHLTAPRARGVALFS